MSETRTICLELRPRFLKSQQMCTEIMARVPENPGLKIKANMSIIWISMPKIKTTVPRNQDHSVCYHRQMLEKRTVCLESGPRHLKSRLICTEVIIAGVPEIPGKRPRPVCL